MIKKQMMVARERVPQKIESVGPVFFDFQKIIAGIVYHVVEEGIALAFNVESVTRATERLRRQDIHPTISRSQWGEMTNEQRLTWLLVESRTCVVLSGGVASLGPLRSETMIAL